MPGLTIEKELELLEEKVAKLISKIKESNSFEEKEILTEELISIVAEIIILSKIISD